MRDWCIISGVEAMHLLPHGFAMQATYSSQGRLRERRRSSSQSLFGSVGKPAASPPAAGFLFWPGTLSAVSRQCPTPCHHQNGQDIDQRDTQIYQRTLEPLVLDPSVISARFVTSRRQRFVANDRIIRESSGVAAIEGTASAFASGRRCSRRVISEQRGTRGRVSDPAEKPQID